MKHGSNDIVSRDDVRARFDDAFDGTKGSLSLALDALRRWRPKGVRAYLEKQHRATPSLQRMAAMMRDVMVVVADRIEAEVDRDEYDTGDEVIQAATAHLFHDGLLLEYIDSGFYADVLSREQIIRLFDEAFYQGDEVKLGSAVEELLRFAVDTIKSKCRQDGDLAEEIVWSTITTMVRGQFNRIWRDLGKACEDGEADLPLTGEDIVDRVMARLCGFKKADGHRAPGAVKKYWAGRVELLSLDAAADKTASEDGATWADLLPDRDMEESGEQGPSTNLEKEEERLEREEQRKEILNGQLADLKRFADSQTRPALKETAQVLVELCQEAIDRDDTDGITVYIFRQTTKVATRAMDRLAELFHLKQEKRIRDRVMEIRALLESNGLAAPKGTRLEIRERIVHLQEDAESWYGEPCNGQSQKDNKRKLKTVRAVCEYLQDELCLPGLDNSNVIEISFLHENSQRVLNSGFSQLIQDRCKVSADAARKRLADLADGLREWGLLQRTDRNPNTAVRR